MNRLITIPLFLAPLCLSAASLRPAQLRCEYRVNPLGIDVLQPRLSWVLEAVDPKARNLKQSAYQVVVTTGAGVLWDSGKVDSDQSIHVVYRGKPLKSGMQASWKVQVWDQAGLPSGWSKPAFWSMGLLKPEDWKGLWIGRDEPELLRDPHSPFRDLTKARWIWGPTGGLFSTTFTVPGDRDITRAICVMTADNHFELSVNGTPAGKGSRVQAPEIVDLTSLIHPGSNEVSVRAANPRNTKAGGLVGAVRIEFASGAPLLVYTGPQWKTSEDQPVTDLGPYGIAPWGEVGFTEERFLPARMLRKEFDAGKKVKRAMAYLSGLGLSELYLNGHKAGDQVLSPGLTDYDKRVLYVTFDVTNLLVTGHNAIGLILGNGRYYAPRLGAPIGSRSFGYPEALLQLNLEYEDGTTSSVVTDDTWKLTTMGPVRGNNEYDGEEYDARLEMPGWGSASFDDKRWERARLVETPPGVMAAQMAEPLRVEETIRPVNVKRLRPGVYIFDMGQNMVGWCRLKVSGPKGTRVSLRHAETLKKDGSLYVANLRSARATDFYTLKGEGTEVWEPRFTYHGFRYVELTGFPGEPDRSALEGRVVHDAMAQTADFETSNQLLNHIHSNIFWGVRGNYRSIPTDCPQRDERQGWLGDRSMVSRSESYLFDVAAFYSKWMTDLVDSQRPNGSIPNVAPAYWVLYSDNITWPSTFILVPGMLYDQYGDRRVIERDYPAMRKWVEYMRRYMKGDLMPRDTYGDWCVPPESPELIHSKDPARKTDGTLLGTTYYYEILKLMARYARLVNKPADVAEYENLAQRVKTAFEEKFFKPAAGHYDNGTQTSSILPLAFGMTAQQHRKAVFASLIEKIEKESNGHVGTGLVGAQWLMRTLSDNGRADVAYQIANQKTYPGWGYMVEQGATTIWELWNGNTADPAMNSGNHVMQIGDLGIWFYEYLAGIRPDPQKPGFKHIIIRPYPVGDLTFVQASHKSMYGEIKSSWKRDGNRIQLDVTIPPNTTATVYVPTKAGPVMHVVGSGSYSFTSTM
jgi:alpha-L-rhamnosidase